MIDPPLHTPSTTPYPGYLPSLTPIYSPLTYAPPPLPPYPPPPSPLATPPLSINVSRFYCCYCGCGCGCCCCGCGSCDFVVVVVLLWLLLHPWQWPCCVCYEQSYTIPQRNYGVPGGVLDVLAPPVAHCVCVLWRVWRRHYDGLKQVATHAVIVIVTVIRPHSIDAPYQHSCHLILSPHPVSTPYQHSCHLILSPHAVSTPYQHSCHLILSPHPVSTPYQHSCHLIVSTHAVI